MGSHTSIHCVISFHSLGLVYDRKEVAHMTFCLLTVRGKRDCPELAQRWDENPVITEGAIRVLSTQKHNQNSCVRNGRKKSEREDQTLLTYSPLHCW